MIFLWAGAAACALAYWGFVLSAPSLVRSLLKTTAVALLALIAAWQGLPLLALALAACALGDWLLSREGETAFMAGVGAFALGHLLYIWLFLSQTGGDVSGLGGDARLYALIVLGIAMAGLLLPRAGALRLPVALYIPIILGMGAAALALPVGLVLALVGAGFFILSDCILALERFVIPSDHPAHRILGVLVWPLYWAAQALFLYAFVGAPAF